jgi:hypothetical protein
LEFRPAGARLPQTAQGEAAGDTAAAWEQAEPGSNGNQHREAPEPIAEEARELLRQEEEEGPSDVGPDAPDIA